MKVPFPANSTQNNSKPPSHHTYEPKSVLELRESPVTEKPVIFSTTTSDTLAVICDDPFQLEADDHDHDHVLMINQQLVDWNSLRELGLHDDPGPVSIPIRQLNSHSETQIIPTDHQYSNLTDQFVPADFGLLSDFPTYSLAPLSHNTNGINSSNSLSGDLNSNSRFDVDELLRLAECFDTNSVQLRNVILVRINQSLSSPTGKPLQRAAFYFKEALCSLLTGPTLPIHHAPNSWQIIETIKAQKAFSSISPIPMFSSFTANQAVLEALVGSLNVHVIDFDIGLGGQWASFMKGLADKAGSLKAGLRISAVVSEEYVVESRLIRENLTQFARELNIVFNIEFVSIRTFGYLFFKAIKFVDGEKVAVLLSPAIFRHQGTGFLSDLRQVWPDVVVHVDIEGRQMDLGTPSHRQAVIDGLELYSSLLESLEAANFDGGGDWIRRIEKFVVFPKIVEGMEAAGRRGTRWREALAAAGLREVGLSRFAEFQAECLLRRVQVRGFHVVKRQAEMLLCWNDRPIVATSAWRY